ncbi:bifunctional adenosylcobinamide kinase/adenosylcobinamide-phosphate guanylyltransferase [Peribacillus alkalitolerans]|uniref:bifunctional adenosylcobinamide kinase/adenosylcobinamide-phosphate guanylyltransferase n=1 Tax=Peribacillus alkalitolerans TaxID=1550385 RepID=UPI0013D74715|nr:bifunctional adenosylcobinamide kinase/adenosylcobinamide-phosphate guanylyltransferase [Peribacillus alkalitolerans]
MLIFITGGVRSGKSTFAENLLTSSLPTGETPHYIATSIYSDGEMSSRIRKHQLDRELSGYTWITWEKSKDIHEMCNHLPENSFVLLDCMTTWLNNELFSEVFEGSEDWMKVKFQKEKMNHILHGIESLKKHCSKVILVSNEVSYEPIMDKGLVFQYVKIMGKLHQEIVGISNQAYLIQHGVPILMKGLVLK